MLIMVNFLASSASQPILEAMLSNSSVEIFKLYVVSTCYSNFVKIMSPIKLKVVRLSPYCCLVRKQGKSNLWSQSWSFSASWFINWLSQWSAMKRAIWQLKPNDSNNLFWERQRIKTWSNWWASISGLFCNLSMKSKSTNFNDWLFMVEMPYLIMFGIISNKGMIQLLKCNYYDCWQAPVSAVWNNIPADYHLYTLGGILLLSFILLIMAKCASR